MSNMIIHSRKQLELFRITSVSNDPEAFYDGYDLPANTNIELTFALIEKEPAVLNINGDFKCRNIDAPKMQILAKGNIYAWSLKVNHLQYRHYCITQNELEYNSYRTISKNPATHPISMVQLAHNFPDTSKTSTLNKRSVLHLLRKDKGENWEPTKEEREQFTEDLYNNPNDIIGYFQLRTATIKKCDYTHIPPKSVYSKLTELYKYFEEIEEKSPNAYIGLTKIMLTFPWVELEFKKYTTYKG